MVRSFGWRQGTKSSVEPVGLTGGPRKSVVSKICASFLPEDQNDDFKVRLQFVAPKSLRKTILQYLHNHKTGGHLGLTKTLYNVRQRFYWPGQRSDVACWCHRCQECGDRKSKKGKKASLKQEDCWATHGTYHSRYNGALAAVQLR